MNSQLPISVDEKDAVNPFISPSDKRGCQWRNKCDQGWKTWRDYQLLVPCQRKKLYQQYFEFVNKCPRWLNAPLN